MARRADVDFEIVALTDGQRPLLDALAQLYQYDFNEFDGEPVPADGRFGWVDLDVFYAQPEHHAFLVEVGREPGGFATVYRGESFRDPAELVWWMSDFFMMRKHRRHGIGRSVAMNLFDRFPGTWEVAQIRSNTVAQSFWRSIIGEYTEGAYDEVMYDDGRWVGPVQYFEVSRTRAR